MVLFRRQVNYHRLSPRAAARSLPQRDGLIMVAHVA
eukprot:COSAG02_NODE_30698_length_546_cov_1.740492_2_plen_35_part_01